MECIKQLKNNIYIFKVSGNSRLRILNDYEQKLISKSNIQFRNNDMFIRIHAAFKVDLYNKNYYLLKYYNGELFATACWKYTEFTPSYVIYPIAAIANKTFNDFNIASNVELCNNLIIDEREKNKNDEIMDNEYNNEEYVNGSVSSYSDCDSYISEYSNTNDSVVSNMSEEEDDDNGYIEFDKFY